MLTTLLWLALSTVVFVVVVLPLMMVAWFLFLCAKDTWKELHRG